MNQYQAYALMLIRNLAKSNAQGKELDDLKIVTLQACLGLSNVIPKITPVSVKVADSALKMIEDTLEATES